MPEPSPLSRLDLNLLVSLDALLTERSVTRAAERLHLSQPALSASLSRLRAHFNDPILARHGNSYDLTPLALRLVEHTSTALDSARRVFESQASWAPMESIREFSIFGSDYGFVTVGKVASELAAERAPGVRFRFMLHNPGIVEDASNKLRSVDGMVIPHGHVSDLPFTDLWRDDWVAIVSDSPDASSHSDLTLSSHSDLTLQDLEERPWVMTFQSRSAYTSAARQVQQLGIEPHVAVVVESFLSMPHFIAGTDRIGLIQAALAPLLLPAGGVRTIALPFEATPLVNALWWHPAHNHDPEHAWMRALFVEAGRIVEQGTHQGSIDLIS